MGAVELTGEQRLAVENAGGQILVSAAAGSGKTRVLVERLLRYIEDGEDIDRFLIITYTNAAAAELRGKIMDALMDEISGDPTNLRLRRQANLAGRAHIETIHSFCAGLIRENAHILGIQPDFRIADEAEAKLMRQAALAELLEELYDSADPDFYALADTLGAGRDDRALEGVILDTHTKLMSHPSPEEWIRRQLESLELGDIQDAGQTVWGRTIMERARQAARFWRERMEYLVDEAQADPKLEKGYGASFRGTYESLREFERALEGTWDEARRCADIAFPSGRISGYEELKAVRADCKKAMGKVSALFWDDSRRALDDMAKVAGAERALLNTVMSFDRRYAALKRKRGTLDFSDQEHMALSLLRDAGTGRRTDTAVSVSERFTEIMVDEYQDVNEIQEEIFKAVSRDGRNIFTVGDVKQSIYRFRLADPTIFLRKYLTFPDAAGASDGEPRRIVLSRNFRSRRGILDAVNFIFKNTMSRTVGDLDYTEREFLYPGADSPEWDEPEVELDVIDLKTPEEDGETQEEIDDKSAAEALFAARRIKELVAKVKLRNTDGTERPLEYGDIAVLMRSPRSSLPRWQQVFAGEGVPMASDQSTDFFTEPEVSLALSIMAVIDNPRQDIPLISVLRSPVFGFTGDELAQVRLYDREGDFWSALKKASGRMEKCADFLETLSVMRRAAPDMSAEELLWYVYTKTDLFAVAAAMPDGETRRDNLMTLLELAHSCENSGNRGLFGFVSYIRALREQGQGPETPKRSSGNAVTVMSIHKSKGLEFPVVILAELTHKFNTEDTRARLLVHPELGVGPKLTDTQRKIEYYTIARRAVAERLKGEMLSEELRVLYVAMTRARDKLIMLASYSDAQKALSKLANCELPVPPEVMRGCASMAEWILMPALRRPESGAIRFGKGNVPCDTQGEVWDVRLVSGAAAFEGGAGTEPVPEAGEVAEMGDIAEMLDYEYPYMAASGMPSKITATELKGTYRTQEAAEEAAKLQEARDETVPERPAERPAFMEGAGGLSAAQKGTAVHVVMQYADFEKCRTPEGAGGEIERLRAMGTITDEQAGAVRPEIISGFFKSEPGRLILGAKKLHRELKFSLLVNSGQIPGFTPGEQVLLQGVVDCCIEEDDALTVIDFKTDRVRGAGIRERAEYYRGQLDAYAMALTRMLGKPVTRRVLCFLNAGEYVDL